jgi:DNA-binding NarL/FixJ family response regulator
MLSGRVTESNAIEVLIADSNTMQAQLLMRTVSRRKQFVVSHCEFELDPILDRMEEGRVNVLVVNADRSGEPDMVVLRRLHLACPQAEKILLIQHYDRRLVVNAFRSGVRGLFCFSEHPFRLLSKCIQCVHDGQVWATSEQLQYLLEAVAQVPSLRVVNSGGGKLLSPREEQVVALVADGLSNREIAQEFNLSEHTVKKYVFRIFEKLGISSRVELVLYAVNHGDHREAEWLSR